MSIFEQDIATQIAEMTGIPAEQIMQCIETPKNKDLADYALPIPKLNRFKKLPGNPAALATEYSTKYKTGELVKEVSVAGTYLNFKIDRGVLTRLILKDIFAKGDRYGLTEQGKGKKVIVEFSSPNIAKPFHAGHLRSTIIGNFTANLHRALGYEVTTMNYLGDWGKQYGLLAIGFEKYGSEEELLKDPIIHLYNVYVKINADGEQDPTIHDRAREYFKRMEDGDQEALGLWKKFRDLSIVKYKDIYARLNVTFDIYSGESLMCDGMEAEYKKMVEKNLVKESEGAQIIDFENNALGKVLVKKKDGSTLYITRDIAAVQYRKRDLGFDKMIYVVATQQELHFRQLFKIVEMMGYDFRDQLSHIGFGMVKGMSTRKGTVVFLEEILNESKSIMLETMMKNESKYAEVENPEEVADILAVSAVMIQDFSAKRNKDYDFKWDRMLSFEGDTGPYLQYAHARLCSMERKTGIKFNPEADLTLLVEPEAHELAYQLSRFGEVIQYALTNTEPNAIATYLFEISHAVSSAINVLWIKDREQNLAEARMALFWCAKNIIGNGLRLLGLRPLERM